MHLYVYVYVFVVLISGAVALHSNYIFGNKSTRTTPKVFNHIIKENVSFWLYIQYKIIFQHIKLKQFLLMRKYCILQDRIWNKDLNCKSKYNGESSKCLREIFITDIFYTCQTKLAWAFLRDPFSNCFFFKQTGKNHFFVSPDKRSHIQLPNLKHLQFQIAFFICSVVLNDLTTT